MKGTSLHITQLLFSSFSHFLTLTLQEIKEMMHIIMAEFASKQDEANPVF